MGSQAVACAESAAFPLGAEDCENMVGWARREGCARNRPASPHSFFKEIGEAGGMGGSWTTARGASAFGRAGVSSRSSRRDDSASAARD